MTLFSARQLQREAERELALRKRVYPKFVEGGRLSDAAARRQIAMMEAIALRLRREAEVEEQGNGLL